MLVFNCDPLTVTLPYLGCIHLENNTYTNSGVNLKYFIDKSCKSMMQFSLYLRARIEQFGILFMCYE